MNTLRKLIREILASPCGDDEFDEILATAQHAHRGQTRRSGEPYINHPIEVASIVNRYYPGQNILCKAALLHDALEDAPALGNVKDEQELFTMIANAASSQEESSQLLHLLMALTKHEGSNYAEYVLSLADDPDALKIKLSDMLHNIQTSPGPRQLTKYQNALSELENKYQGIPPGLSNSHWSDIKAAAGLAVESNMRVYVRNFIMEARNKPPGAGIVIVRQFEGRWKILGLRVYGKYDFPKGVIEAGESAMQAAVRETYEEAGISDLNFLWGTTPLTLSQLTLFLAETQEDGEIRQNPHTGIWEHHGLEWLEWDQLSQKIIPYLQPAVNWARGIVESV